MNNAKHQDGYDTFNFTIFFAVILFQTDKPITPFAISKCHVATSRSDFNDARRRLSPLQQTHLMLIWAQISRSTYLHITYITRCSWGDSNRNSFRKSSANTLRADIIVENDQTNKKNHNVIASIDDFVQRVASFLVKNSFLHTIKSIHKNMFGTYCTDLQLRELRVFLRHRCVETILSAWQIHQPSTQQSWRTTNAIWLPTSSPPPVTNIVVTCQIIFTCSIFSLHNALQRFKYITWFIYCTTYNNLSL